MIIIPKSNIGRVVGSVWGEMLAGFDLEPYIGKRIRMEMPYIVSVARPDHSMKNWCNLNLGIEAVNLLSFNPSPRQWCSEGVWALWGGGGGDDFFFFAFRDPTTAVDFKLRFG